MSSTSNTASSSSLLALSGSAMPTHLMADARPANHGLLHHLATALAAVPYAIGIFCVWLFERDEFDSANQTTAHGDKTNTKTDEKMVHRAKQPEDYDPWVVPMFWC